MNKPANTDHPIHENLKQRWSPRAFAEKTVDEPAVRSLMEAARWAASSMNEQPWRFIVAMRQDRNAFDRLAACLVPFNREWAQHAGVLVAVVAAERFAKNDEPNRHAWHDAGQAVASLTVEATARGLAVHQMGGIDAGAIRETYEIPDGYSPVSVVAIGYPGEPEQLQKDLAERERLPRVRRPQSDFVFAGAWGQAL